MPSKPAFDEGEGRPVPAAAAEAMTSAVTTAAAVVIRRRMPTGSAQDGDVLLAWDWWAAPGGTRSARCCGWALPATAGWPRASRSALALCPIAIGRQAELDKIDAAIRVTAPASGLSAVL